MESEFTRSRNAYFNWLCFVVGMDDEDFLHMMHILHDIPFHSEHPLDKNRAMDGEDLRDIWYDLMMETEEMWPEFCREALDDRPCSVLEMMVALSMRCENEIMWEQGKDDWTGVWFQCMLNNLEIDPDMDDFEICEIIEFALDRRYDRFGRGGFWPFTVCHDRHDLNGANSRDARTMDIWTQMNAWLSDNYGF